MVFQLNMTPIYTNESLSQHTLGIKGLTEGNKTISLVIKIITNHKENNFLYNALV